MNHDVFNYYKNYYFDQLGIPYWKQLVEARLNEDNSYGLDISVLFHKDYFLNVSRKALVVGSGTGVECRLLKRLGFSHVVGIEPNHQAIKISNQYATDGVEYICSVAESINLKDGTFDYVHCYTVLEHVQTPLRVIHEIHRLLKPQGFSYIAMPNYNHIFEGHYKVILPLFLGKSVSSFLLSLYKRPKGFLDSLNFLNNEDMKDLLVRSSFNTYRQSRLIKTRVLKLRTLLSSEAFKQLYSKITGISQMQEWLLTK